jgi:hypothetical protein
MNICDILERFNNRGVNYCTIKKLDLSENLPNVFIRHDLDDKKESGKWMLENEMDYDARSVLYIFPWKYDEDVVTKFNSMGWEIGLHLSVFHPERTDETIETFKEYINGFSFDTYSYTFHGSTACYCEELIPEIKKIFPHLKEFPSFTKSLNRELYVTDSMSVRKIGLNRRVFFNWNEIPEWFPEKLDDPRVETETLLKTIDNMENGKIYTFNFHPQFWNKEGDYVGKLYRA